MGSINISDFRIKEGQKDFSLENFPTSLRQDLFADKAEYKRKLEDRKSKMQELQELLYASGTNSILFGIQAMDTAGKDGLMEHVFTGLNPQGCRVTAFKKPTELERKHGWIWRHDVALPEAGMIGVWNRTHYEEVGVVRVHPEYLKDPKVANSKFWRKRLDFIRDWERELTKEGTAVVKIFLHISPEEQARRLLSRTMDPAKHWKFNPGDLVERKLWPKYMRAFSKAIAATSTADAPWYVVPGNDKKEGRLIVADIVVHHLRQLDLKVPKLSSAQKLALKSAATALREELGEK